jgi:hypothetical protein
MRRLHTAADFDMHTSSAWLCVDLGLEMKRAQAGARSQERRAERAPAPATALVAETNELIRAVAMVHRAGGLTVQEHRALVKLIDAIALLLGEVPENI